MQDIDTISGCQRWLSQFYYTTLSGGKEQVKNDFLHGFGAALDFTTFDDRMRLWYAMGAVERVLL